ncbi:WXG100 family type VII secretion target [Nocardia gipuzkoensis]
MADPITPGPTQWAGLTGSVDDGILLLDDGIALTCAEHVQDTLGVVAAVQNYIVTNVGVASPTIAESVSGRLLWTVFNLKFGTQLKDRIDRHHQILVDMGKTFVAAGKRFAATENESGAVFDDINLAPPPSTLTGGPKTIAIPKSVTRVSSQTVFDEYAITPELGSQVSWQQLWIIGNSIQPQAVADAAGVWRYLSSTLDTAFTELRTAILGTEDRWQGLAATAARGATSSYVEASGQLTTDMNHISDTLLYVAGWVQQTKEYSMPPTPEPPPPTTVEQQQRNDADLRTYQTHFQTYYSNSYSTTTTRIVTLPTPDPVTTPGVAADETGNGRVPTGSTPQVKKVNLGNENLDGGGAPGGGDEDGGGGGGGGGDGLPGGQLPNDDDLTIDDPTDGSNWQNKSLLDEFEENLLDLAELNSDPTTSEHTPGVLTTTPTPLGGSTTSTTGRAGSGGGVGGRPPVTNLSVNHDPKLFPRATTLPEAKFVGRAGPVGGMPPGMPYGGVPGRPTDSERERQRQEYLTSGEHLDEALGTPGRGIKPVLDR